MKTINCIGVGDTILIKSELTLTFKIIKFIFPFLFKKQQHDIYIVNNVPNSNIDIKQNIVYELQELEKNLVKENTDIDNSIYLLKLQIEQLQQRKKKICKRISNRKKYRNKIINEIHQLKMKKTYTKGNIIVEDIKVGDIHYEYEYNCGRKCKVLTLPVRDDSGYWTWTSENLNTGKILNYGVREGYSHYAPNLYDCEAYQVNNWI